MNKLFSYRALRYELYTYTLNIQNLFKFLNSIQFPLRRKLVSFRFQKNKGFASDLRAIVGNNVNKIPFAQ